MLLTLPDDDTLYAALLARDESYEGRAFVCVSSTGIFCRLTCPARKPLRENCRFHDSIAGCLAQGYRPCLRCKPMQPRGDADPLIQRLLSAMDEDPQRRWTAADIAAMGLDPSTVRRAFRRRFGMSFLELARARRIGGAVTRLAKGAPVIEAQLEGGYDSGSGFRAAVTRALGTAPTRVKGQGLLAADWIETPLGPMLAVADAHALHLLEFADRPALMAELERIKMRTGQAIIMADNPVIVVTRQALRDYFMGESADFPIRLAPAGTPFQHRVWDTLRAIPSGETRSYADLAKALDQPSATRAVAQANGANPLAIIVPCHRVIGADGSLTGYGGGLWRKQWLLRHEARMKAEVGNG